jgi:hypothetical protein
MTEDDTFKALKRVPISDLVREWRASLPTGLYEMTFVEYLEHHNYGVDEYIIWHQGASKRLA